MKHAKIHLNSRGADEIKGMSISKNLVIEKEFVTTPV